MGRKKFIDKKKSATFQLLARDSADPNYDQGPSGDRIFVRVDNNPFSVDDFGDDEDAVIDADAQMADDPDSIFADADEEEDGHEVRVKSVPASSSSLPDNIRREILELGFPDDGYNYLLHLREIKNTGGGSAYYENSKATVEHLSNDVKAYDASRVHVSGVDDEFNDNSIYSVAAKTIGVRVQKVVDPEVAALLDDSDLSRFGSDAEDLEEDFVVQASHPEEGELSVVVEKNIDLANEQKGIRREHPIASGNYFPGESRSHHAEGEPRDEKPRVRRLLDEQFDMLTLQEYGSESDSDHGGSVASEDECLAEKLNHVLKDHVKDDLELEGKYKVPADFLRENEGSNNDEAAESAAQVIRRCAEYGKRYEDENQDDKDVVILEESSDEDEMWDCETIVTTLSNLDNHPAKIGTPGMIRKKKLAEAVSGVDKKVIALEGKYKFPVGYLPGNKKAVLDRVEEVPEPISNKNKRPPGESKEEKKERKAAVKEEKREARKAKKELKGIYRCETQFAQKVAASSGPSSIHLM